MDERSGPEFGCGDHTGKEGGNSGEVEEVEDLVQLQDVPRVDDARVDYFYPDTQLSTVAFWQPLQSPFSSPHYLPFPLFFFSSPSEAFRGVGLQRLHHQIARSHSTSRNNPGAMAKTLFVNGRILSKTETGLNGAAQFSDSMLVQGDKIVAVGSRRDIARGSTSDVEVRDLNQRIVLPGFIDGHMHLLLLGQSLRKVDLSRCKTLDEIRSCVRQYAVENPEIPTILCKGWRHHMTPDGVTAAMYVQRHQLQSLR